MNGVFVTQTCTHWPDVANWPHYTNTTISVVAILPLCTAPAFITSSQLYSLKREATPMKRVTTNGGPARQGDAITQHFSLSWLGIWYVCDGTPSAVAECG